MCGIVRVYSRYSFSVCITMCATHVCSHRRVQRVDCSSTESYSTASRGKQWEFQSERRYRPLNANISVCTWIIVLFREFQASKFHLQNVLFHDKLN